MTAAAHGGRGKPRRARLDRLLVTLGLARSRERAQALILAGVVRIDGHPAGKAGTLVPENAALTVVADDHPYVGRGGLKLRSALAIFGVDPQGRVALDVGASTGGFTDCLLQGGARKVYALDVGVGQLDWSLRSDPRVVVLEGRNARYLEAADLPERVDLATVDVSFISLGKILPALPPLLLPEAALLTLVKPQFEVGRRDVGRGGIVRDPALHRAVLASVAEAAIAAEFAVLGACASPITGMEGNREFFLHLTLASGTTAALDAAARGRLFGAITDVGDGSTNKD